MSLSTALAPVAARLIAQFSDGVTVRLRQRAAVRQPDGSSASTWSDVVGLSAAPVIVESLSAARALKVWGAAEAVHAQATLALPAGLVLTPINLAGRLAGGVRDGTTWTIVGITSDDTSRTAVLALQATRDALGLS